MPGFRYKQFFLAGFHNAHAKRFGFPKREVVQEVITGLPENAPGVWAKVAPVGAGYSGRNIVYASDRTWL